MAAAPLKKYARKLLREGEDNTKPQFLSNSRLRGGVKAPTVDRSHGGIYCICPELQISCHCKLCEESLCRLSTFAISASSLYDFPISDSVRSVGRKSCAAMLSVGRPLPIFILRGSAAGEPNHLDIFMISRFQTNSSIGTVFGKSLLTKLSNKSLVPSRPLEYFYAQPRACEKTEIEAKHTKHQWVPRRSKAVPQTAVLNDLYLYINLHLPKKLIWHVSASRGQKDAAIPQLPPS
jgi:hypothetical protein